MISRRLTTVPTWPTAFGTLDDAHRELEQMFRRLSEFRRTGGSAVAGLFPAVNLSEDRERIFVRSELPGIELDDLEITLEHGTLTLAGERKNPAEEDGVSYHRRERDWGRFRRSITIPVEVDAEAVDARYRDGILTVTLPKLPEAKPRRISIHAEA